MAIFDELIELYNEANELCDRQQFSDAIDFYTRAIERDPLASRMYREQLPPELAGTPFDQCDGIYTSPKAYFNRATAFTALDRFMEAVSDYSEVIRICPEFKAAYFSRGVCHLMMGMSLEEEDPHQALAAYAQSKNDFEFLAEQHGVDSALAESIIDVLTRSGAALNRTNRSEESVVAIHSAVQLLHQMAEFTRNEFDEDDQAAVLDGLRRKTCSLRDTLAEILSTDRLGSTAVVAAEHCLHLGRVCHTLLQQFDLSEEFFARCERALAKLAEALRPDAEAREGEVRLRSQLHNLRGLLFRDSGRCGEAAVEFQAAVDLRTLRQQESPADWDNRIYLGGAHCNLGFNNIDQWQLEEAQQYFREASRILLNCSMNSEGPLKELAQQFLENARVGLQEVERWEAVSSDVNEAEYSSLCVEVGHETPSSEFRNPFTEEFPVNSGLTIDADTCQLDSALNQLSTWLDQHDGDASGWYWKGRWQSKLGKIEDAIASMTKAYKLEPSFHAAAFELADLQRRHGDLLESRSTCEALLSQNRHEAEVHYLLGVISAAQATRLLRAEDQPERTDESFEVLAFDSSMAESAARCFSEALLLDPSDHRIRLAKADVLARLARAQDAGRGTLQSIYEMAMPDEVERRLQYANRAFMTTLWRSAELYAEVLHSQPDHDGAQQAWKALCEEYPSVKPS